MIKPTVGRVVWYFHAGQSHESEPQAALVVSVIDDMTINVAGFEHDGTPFAQHNVLLLSDGESYGNPSGGPWAKWMPYQHGQAAKTEALEKEAEGGKHKKGGHP